MTQYSPKIDQVVYRGVAIRDFSQGDWLKLAMAAIDQAGISVKTQEEVADLLCIEQLEEEL